MTARLRRRLERQLHVLNVPLPRPFTADEFCARLARTRGRPIHLLPWDTTGAMVPCGLWVSTDRADYIIYEQATTEILRQHIILHEVAHLVLGHAGALDLGVATDVFDVLDPSMVRRVLGRTSAYDADEEREAEVLASLIGEQAAEFSSGLPRQMPASDAAVIHRLGSALAADLRHGPSPHVG
jgi:hypothetical protein